VSQSKPATPDPERIGRYEVVKRLGAGAMGTVYKARDPDLGRFVAIKTIRLESLLAAGASLEDTLKRFEIEARTAAQLKHPNILTIYEIGKGEGFSYIAMEYIDGIGLDRILSEGGAVPVDRAANLVAQVADALAFAHKKNVFHRDIKPANIMVEEGDRVKVTDFGIAKATESGEDLTRTGSILGTPSYMSPEQARDSSKIDGRSDLFSLGCVLYELLAGKKAFRGDSITNVLFKVIAEDPPPITEIDPTIPEAAVRIVSHALVKDREKRYQTGLEMAQDLRALPHAGPATTIRTSEANHPTLSLDPTAQGSVPGIPTIATPGTVATPPTVASAPTRVTGTPPPIPPPVPAARPPAPPAAPPVPRPAVARSGRPASARPQPGGGGKAVVLVGGAAVVLLLVFGAWWMIGRGAAPTPPPGATPGADGSTTTPTTLQAADVEPTSSSSPVPAEATPAPAATAPPGSRVASATPPPTPATSPAKPPASSTPSGPATHAAPSTSAAPGSPAPSDDFLDSIPTDDSPDGRAMAAELSRGFSSSGGNSSFGTSRNLRRRTVIPPHTAAEQPAVRTLAWILTAEKAHHRRTGRFGSFSEIVGARDLPLEQAPGSDGFSRRGYRFTVRTTDEGFRAEAQPQTSDGRAFYVDEAGYVLILD